MPAGLQQNQSRLPHVRRGQPRMSALAIWFTILMLVLLVIIATHEGKPPPSS